MFGSKQNDVNDHVQIEFVGEINPSCMDFSHSFTLQESMLQNSAWDVYMSFKFSKFYDLETWVVINISNIDKGFLSVFFHYLTYIVLFLNLYSKALKYNVKASEKGRES